MSDTILIKIVQKSQKNVQKWSKFVENDRFE